MIWIIVGIVAAPIVLSLIAVIIVVLFGKGHVGPLSPETEYSRRRREELDKLDMH